LVHLQSKNEFEDWISMNGSGSLGERYYIFDYDLKADLNGIDLIEKYNLRLEATVISGMADAPDVLARARGAKVKLLNKNGLQRTKIRVIETDAPGPKNWNSCKISDDASNLTKGGLGNEESIHGGADY
jgi:hypothetical protein